MTALFCVAHAEVKLAPLFQNGAVLQREMEIPVWGRAEPGEELSVRFADQEKKAVVGKDGRWQVRFPAMPANAQGQSLTISASKSEAVEITDLLVGEVWLGSGQSNMQWAISQVRKEDQDVAANAKTPLLRLFQVPRALNHVRQEQVTATWQNATPETVRQFSAVGYFFGKHLSEELNVPIGIIHSSWGGSRIEPWWAEEGLDGIESLADLRKRRLMSSPGFPEYLEAAQTHLTAVKLWAQEAESALAGGLPSTRALPQSPGLLKLGHNAETGTYQAMIHPLVPYALRGFLWYQGESNNGESMAYTEKKRALIQGWRKQFRNDKAPFLFVQLAPYHYGNDRDEDLPRIWWAQQATLEIPHTGMVVTNDIGNVKDIHPTNKSEVGRRLALWAMADTYGKKDLVKSGPLFSGFKVTEKGVAVRFDHTGGGLTTRDGKAPNWFQVAGNDGKFHPAEAKISDDGTWILLTNSQLKATRARFAWSQIAEPNLMNREGLPAAAFHTHWPEDLTLGKKISQGKPHVSSDPNQQGWDSGLTDGQWGNNAGTCYATHTTANFPKMVTLDLGEVRQIHAVLFGTPAIGSTKTVALSISENGTDFREMDRHDFAAKRAEQREARFDPTAARYVRATFLAQHPKQDHFSENFCFLAEMEVYEP